MHRAGSAGVLFAGVLFGAVVFGGCSRTHYRLRADRDVAEIYAEKRCEEAYTLPPLDGIEVDPRSRFFDPSPEDCPALPFPEPQLFGYELPDLATGDPRRALPTPEVDRVEETPIEELPPVGPQVDPQTEPSLDPLLESLPDPKMELPQPLSHQNGSERGMVSLAGMIAEEASSTQVDWPAGPVSSEVRLAELLRADGEAVAGSESANAAADALTDDEEEGEELRIVPIPPEYWQQLPESCVSRMLEFGSVQKEFRKSFTDAKANPVADLLSDAPRLTLPMITELASINNRAIQTQKETLYRAALVLSAERYEYVLRPTRRGNGTGVFYRFSRFDNVTSDSLSVPTATTVRKTTAMAGQFLMSFANSVVMTFDGPSGFTANVGTDLLFEFQQTVFQRDVVFEDLTRAERNVVYAARDLIRGKRELYLNLAGDYYDLLLAYRQIEIRSQDYFSNLRAFLQARAEYLQAGRIPRVQVDQIEQDALGSSSVLVQTSNRLETDLDRLKLLIGLPPEMPLNLDLEELESLTVSDELTVTRQLVVRSRQTLVDAAENRLGERDAAINGAMVLVNRLIDSLSVRRKIAKRVEPTEEEHRANNVRRRLKLLEARLNSDQLDQVRERELNAKFPPATLIRFARTMDLIEALLQQATRAEILRLQNDSSDDDLDPQDIKTAESEFELLYDRWDEAVADRQLDQLKELVDDATELLKEIRDLTKLFVGDLLPTEESQLEEVIVATVADTVELVDEVESNDVGGLDDVTNDENEAMLLALYQRLSLMNQRGELADARRQIKLAADDLRSILDIRASQTLSANRSLSQPFAPFDFSGDGTQTRLSMALDTPLNRRIERNTYRAALINYQASRRDLIAAEDGIKFEIREDLRTLRVLRNNYEISVASAALAYERVNSTRLQYRLAIGNVVARDFLEAQRAYTSALRSVASDHIDFIKARIELFVDTESIRLDENGYWSGTREESLELPPIPNFYDANPNPYGRLPPCVKYSDEVRQNH